MHGIAGRDAATAAAQWLAPTTWRNLCTSYSSLGQRDGLLRKPMVRFELCQNKTCGRSINISALYWKDARPLHPAASQIPPAGRDLESTLQGPARQADPRRIDTLFRPHSEPYGLANVLSSSFSRD